ncbi:hypothetical protein LR007_01645 [candidate division NPL-UPA2 bacterium]|nr:hypothetical protein [candidate division NPL-UPA2 bacterium]
MSPTVEEISKELDVPSDELIKRGIKSYLQHEIRLAEEDIADIRDKYSVTTREELEKKIKRKEMHSHPAWEDLISWENSEAYIAKLKKTIEKIK